MPMLDLLHTTDLLNRDAIRTPFARWADDLHGICGSFSPVMRDGSRVVRGEARRIEACGIEFSHISNDLDMVRRDWDDVRRDEFEQIFVVMQIEGTCGVEHMDRQSLLDVGDCILIDSTRPTHFHFGGNYSNHISMNFPRHLLGIGSAENFEVARRIQGVDLMAIMLRNLAARVLRSGAGEEQADDLRDMLVNTTRLAFQTEEDFAAYCGQSGDRVPFRLKLVEFLIDRHLTDPALSARWLAEKAGVSMRVLQLHFQALDMTCTTFIRDKRLRLARERLVGMDPSRGEATIAGIAYAVGFNDLSYFNRCFKELFGCRPGDVVGTSLRN